MVQRNNDESQRGINSLLKMRNFNFVRNNLGKVQKIKFDIVYGPYLADVLGQNSGALIRHSDTCGSFLMVPAWS